MSFIAFPKNRSIVVTCHFGQYSVVAANKLTQAGYRQVFDYSKGMEEWNLQKRPVTTGILEKDHVLKPKESVTTGNKVPTTFFNKDSKDEIHKPVYLDYNATTPVDPRVLEVMMPYLTNKFGNAASLTHTYGTDAERAVHQSRKDIAFIIGAASPNEIVFTSGASESNNLAIKGIAHQLRSKGNHIITCVSEHKAVLDPCKALEGKGFEVSYLKIGSDGLIKLQDLIEAMKPSTILVSIMLANNEIGVIQPFREIGKLCRSRGIIFHTDGTQGVGKIQLNVMEDNIDLLSISAHKIYGPKGVGALYVRSGVPLESQIDGGGHEFGMRSGTLNVPGIVGLGECCRIAAKTRVEESQRIQTLRDDLLKKISTAFVDCQVNGSLEHRLSGNLHMSFSGVTSEEVLMELTDVAISSGSACNSRRTGPSHVVQAVGIGPDLIGCTLRFGVGRFTTQKEIDYAADRVISVIMELRKSKKS